VARKFEDINCLIRKQLHHDQTIVPQNYTGDFFKIVLGVQTGWRCDTDKYASPWKTL